MKATTGTTGPKFSGTPGDVPDIPDEPGSGESASADNESPPVVVVKDFTKRPKIEEAVDAPPMTEAKDPPIEAETEEEALRLANEQGRAVFCPKGWVCPSIVRES